MELKYNRKDLKGKKTREYVAQALILTLGRKKNNLKIIVTGCASKRWRHSQEKVCLLWSHL